MIKKTKKIGIIAVILLILTMGAGFTSWITPPQEVEPNPIFSQFTKNYKIYKKINFNRRIK